MLKRILIVLCIIVAVIVLFGLAFFFRFREMARKIDSIEVSEIDLEQIDDGVYPGEFIDFLVGVKLEVIVKEHKITEIKIIDQRSGPGYEAKETIERIIKAQSPRVDAVTGATGSSKTIMIAVQNALQRKQFE